MATSRPRQRGGDSRRRPPAKRRGHQRRPRTPAQRLQAKRQRYEATLERVVEVLRLMRAEHRSLTYAMRRAGTTATTVRRHAGDVLRLKGARYVAARSDRLPRLVKFPTARGLIALPLRSARQASRVAVYWNAVRTYLRAGDLGPLLAFRGKALRVDKLAYPFITNPETLARLYYAGDVGFEDIYAHVA